MKGLALSRAYFEAYGAPMLHEKFPEYVQSTAAGLAGEGSECFGFDDEISRDHDWGPSFCLWLSDGDYAAVGKEMQRAYNDLPGSFLGYPARAVSDYGEGRVGVMPASLFYQKFTGLSCAPQTLAQWRRIPEHFLACATNGEVFTDPQGSFSAVRAALLAFYPEDLRIKKIAARAAIMAQAGQYNYARCLRRGEAVAAACALAEFMNASFSMIYLLNKRYAPFYKWAHRGIADLAKLSETYGSFTELCAEPYAGENPYPHREELIEEICAAVLEELKAQGLTTGNEDFLHDHCPRIMARIADPEIRKMHVMAE
ncbi:MAG: DUF4037 domain-containing protein [Christensenella sp.]|nr:DUF4037 domain-containing protein [Christensenella sp.]